MDKKKIFITGPTSYFGSKFIATYKNTYVFCGISRQDPEDPCDLEDTEAVAQRFHAFAPDFVMHLAADLGRDAQSTVDITKTNPAITQHLVELAQSRSVPFLFTSTEAVYGEKEETGGYTEEDELRPRSPYGESKVLSEKIIQESGLPYLITRGHRYVGRNTMYDRPKQFPDAMQALLSGQEVHLDSKKLFTPTHIDHLCEVFAHHVEHCSDQQVLVNVSVDAQVTFYDFISDIAEKLDIDPSLTHPDGEEKGWLQNTSISTQKLAKIGFPSMSYNGLVDRIVGEYKTD